MVIVDKAIRAVRLAREMLRADRLRWETLDFTVVQDEFSLTWLDRWVFKGETLEEGQWVLIKTPSGKITHGIYGNGKIKTWLHGLEHYANPTEVFVGALIGPPDPTFDPGVLRKFEEKAVVKAVRDFHNRVRERKELTKPGFKVQDAPPIPPHLPHLG